MIFRSALKGIHGGLNLNRNDVYLFQVGMPCLLKRLQERPYLQKLYPNELAS